MYVLERSAVVPLPLQETWDLFYGNELRDLVELSDSIVEVRDYRMRESGLPEYVMVNKAGPMKASHRSDFIVYEPPYRSVDEVRDSSLGGRFSVEHEAVDGGTRVSHRWEVEPHGAMRVLFPILRSFMARDFETDLERIVGRVHDRTDTNG